MTWMDPSIHPSTPSHPVQLTCVSVCVSLSSIVCPVQPSHTSDTHIRQASDASIHRQSVSQPAPLATPPLLGLRLSLDLDEDRDRDTDPLRPGRSRRISFSLSTSSPPRLLCRPALSERSRTARRLNNGLRLRLRDSLRG
uniref:Uncharacterized protein n=1 Tax=Vitrella brassicaformis TaxID=1169539 RepID=A0A7S1PDN9_9ALVE